jgi:hypothetical protein
MKPEHFRNISVTYKKTDKKTKPKRKRFFGPEMLYLYLTGTYMGDPSEAPKSRVTPAKPFGLIDYYAVKRSHV